MKALKQLKTIFLLFAFSLVFVMCGSEGENPVNLSKDQAALSTTQNVENNLKNLETKMKFLENLTIIKDLANMFAPKTEVCSGGTDINGNTYSECHTESEWDGEIKVDFQDTIKKIKDFFNKYIFVEEQLESEDQTSVVYLLKADVFCEYLKDEEFAKEDENFETEMGSDAMSPEYRGDEDGNSDEDFSSNDTGSEEKDVISEEDESYNECKKFLTNIPTRLKFVSYKEGDVDIEVLIGAEKIKLFTVLFHSDLLGVKLDIGGFKALIDMMKEVFPEEMADVSTPEVLNGEIGFEIANTGENEAKITFDISKEIELKTSVKEGAVSLNIKPSYIEFSFDSGQKSVKVTVDVNETSVKFPYQLLVNSYYSSKEDDPMDWEDDEDFKADDAGNSNIPKVSGELMIKLAGINGETTLSEANEELYIKGAGLGGATSGVYLDDQPLISLDLNKDNGGSFDLTVKEAGKLAHFIFEPGLNVEVGFGLKKVSDVIDEIPEFLFDDTYSLILDGSEKPEIAFFNDEDSGNMQGNGEGKMEDANAEEDTEGSSSLERILKVVSGKLTIKSANNPQDTVVVEEGKCLFAKEDEEENGQSSEGNALLKALEANSCEEAK